MDNSEVEKAKTHNIVEMIEYVPNAVTLKTILQKPTGNIRLLSFDSGKGLAEKISPFDTFAQIMEGQGEIVIEGQSYLLESGQGIVIPAHQLHSIKPNGRFKMILSTIKSGYESL